MNAIIFQDFVPQATSQFKTYEDTFFRKLTGFFLCFLFSDYLQALEPQQSLYWLDRNISLGLACWNSYKVNSRTVNCNMWMFIGVERFVSELWSLVRFRTLFTNGNNYCKPHSEISPLTQYKERSFIQIILFIKISYLFIQRREVWFYFHIFI